MSSAKWWQFCLGFNVLMCWMSRQYWILLAQCYIALILITFPHSLLIKWVVLILPGYINQLHAVFILEDIIVHLPYHLLMQFRFYCCLYDRRGKGNSSHAVNFTLMKYSKTICLHFNDTYWHITTTFKLVLFSPLTYFSEPTTLYFHITKIHPRLSLKICL